MMIHIGILSIIFSTYSVNGAQIASFPLDTFGSSFNNDLDDFRRQCGTTQAHKDSLTSAVKPHAERLMAAMRNGQDAFLDLNAVTVGQSSDQPPLVRQQLHQQRQNTRHVQQDSDGGGNPLRQKLNILGQVVQFGKQIGDLKNQRQDHTDKTHQPKQPVRQAPANQQVIDSNLVNYKCENGAVFQVVYEGGNNFDRAVLIMNGIQPIALPLVPSGSGAKYFDGQIEWHTKGPDGILRQSGQELVCEER